MTAESTIELLKCPLTPEAKADLEEELVCELLTPAPWPMTAEEVEERRYQVETIRGCPFPRCSREELHEDEVRDYDAQAEWDLLNALYRGAAPDIRFLFR